MMSEVEIEFEFELVDEDDYQMPEKVIEIEGIEKTFALVTSIEDPTEAYQYLSLSASFDTILKGGKGYCPRKRFVAPTGHMYMKYDVFW